MCCRHMKNINLFGDDLLPNKEQIKLHMFISRMKNRVVSKRDSAGIIVIWIVMIEIDVIACVSNIQR